MRSSVKDTIKKNPRCALGYKYGFAEGIAPGVSREERRAVVHLDAVCPRSDRWALGYPRGPGVARSAGRFVTQRLGGASYVLRRQPRSKWRSSARLSLKPAVGGSIL